MSAESDKPQREDPSAPLLGPKARQPLLDLRSRLHASDARYEKGEEVGRGGMGAVHRVRDRDLERDLAMKVIARDNLDPEAVRRFLDEAQITGQLDHPGVVPVHELGVDADGRAWFTMRLVRGDTVDIVFGKARDGSDGWTRTRALEVILKVCDTIAFAHRKGVLHRDLKPSNVMVGRFGEVYVMDWGLAKVLGQPDTRDLRPAHPPTVSGVQTDRSRQEADSDSPVMTMDGAVVGTPSYMPLEQAEGRVELLDQRADVYAIGAMLYELLTGQKPYVAPGARVSPHGVLAAVRAGPPVPVHRLAKTVPAELVAICDKAMARDLPRRYPDVRSLSDDLRAYLDRRVVRAYRTGAWAESVMWLRRNRLVAVTAFAALLLLGWGVSSRIVASGAMRTRVEAASWTAFHLADRLLTSAEETMETNSIRVDDVRQALLLLARSVEDDPANRAARKRFHWEASRWSRKVRAVPSFVLEHEDGVIDAVFSPDGRRVATASWDKTVKIWEAETATLVSVLPHEGTAYRVAFSPDGRRLASADGARGVVVWDLATREAVVGRHELVDGTPELERPVFSADGSAVLVTSYQRNRAVVLDAATGSVRFEVRHGEEVRGGSFNPDGSLLVTFGHDGKAIVSDARTGEWRKVLEHPGWTVGHAEFDPSGKRLVTAGYDGWVRMWDVATWRELASRRLDTSVSSARFSPDGTRLVAVADENIHVVDSASLRDVRVLEDQANTSDAVFSPDGTRIAVAGAAGSVWETGSGIWLATLVQDQGFDSIAFAPDGASVVSTGWGPAGPRKSAELWRLGAGQFAISVPDGAPAISRDGTTMATITRGGVSVWRLAGDRPLQRIAVEPSATQCWLDEDGGLLATAGDDRLIRIWDAQRSSLVATFPHEGSVFHVGLDAGSGAVAIFTDDTPRSGSRTVWSGRLNGAPHLVRVLSAPDHALCWNGRGTRCAENRNAKGVIVYDLLAGTSVDLPHEHSVNDLCFCDDGRTLVTVTDQALHSWDVVRGEPQGVLDVGGSRVAVDRSGRIAASTSETHPQAQVVDLNATAVVASFACDVDETLMFTHHGDLVKVGASVRVLDRETWKPVAGCGLASNRVQVVGGDRMDFVRSCREQNLYDLKVLRLSTASPDSREIAGIQAIAELLTQQVLSPHGALSPISRKRGAEVRSIAAALCGAEGPLQRLASWVIASGPESPAHPNDATSCRRRADDLIADGSENGVRAVMRLDPGHPLLQIALAAHEAADEALTRDGAKTAAEEAARIRAEFLRDYGLRRLPADAILCARAAEMLLQQDDTTRARLAAEKTLALDPGNAAARHVLDALGR